LQELKQRAAELDAAFEVLPYLVSIHDLDGKYLRANSAMV
jgi:PAS domain-containing protein